MSRTAVKYGDAVWVLSLFLITDSITVDLRLKNKTHELQRAGNLFALWINTQNQDRNE